MTKRQSVQYTIRDVPAEVDLRLRECAALGETSLNQAALGALERGLGVDGGRPRYRSLREIVRGVPKSGIGAWRSALREQDVVNPADWK